MRPRYFLSGLGSMGKRHLLGLVRAGGVVSAVDPNPRAADESRAFLKEAGQDPASLAEVASRWDALASNQSEFDAAVFAETVPGRLPNVEGFLSRFRARSFLLEKPLSADPAALPRFQELFESAGVALDSVSVNFPRRVWPFFIQLREWTARKDPKVGRELTFQLTGGALGLGCNGIHFLDLFLFVTGAREWTLPLARLSAEPVRSGRGSEFVDFGGDFVVRVQGPQAATFFLSLAPESSAPPSLGIRGDGFSFVCDHADNFARLWTRDPESTKPNYRYGADYRKEHEGPLSIPSLDSVTAGWAQRTTVLPTLAQGLDSHRLLFDLLRAGGARGPHAFT